MFVFPEVTITYFNCFLFKKRVKLCFIIKCRRQLFQGMLRTKNVNKDRSRNYEPKTTHHIISHLNESLI